MSFAQPVAIQANGDTITDTIVSGPYTFNNLTENDSSSGPIYLYAVSKPARGRVEIRPGNVVIYTPSTSFRGEDTFQYAISSSPNGGGSISSATVTIRNPYYINRGTYTSAIAGAHQTHEDSGYLSLTVDPKGVFTASVRFAGHLFPIKAVFDAGGHYTATIVRPAPLSALSLDIQFPFEGPQEISCVLTNGAETTPFIAPLNLWSSINPPALAGRYTLMLPIPDLNLTTPKGGGYATMVIGVNGTATFTGRTGDNRRFTTSTKLHVNNKVPLYSPLYSGRGSIFGDVILNRIDTDSVSLDASLVWTKLRNTKDRYFRSGFIRTITARGSNYIVPQANTCVLNTSSVTDFNSNFTLAGGILRLPRTERALLGNRPDFDLYKLAFDNSKRLQASISISAANGTFFGSFFDVRTRKRYTVSGVFAQGDNVAYGIWSTTAIGGRPGSVMLVPDSIE